MFSVALFVLNNVTLGKYNHIFQFLLVLQSKMALHHQRVQDKFLICLVPTTLAVAGKYWRHLTAKVVSTVAFQNKIKNLSCTPTNVVSFF